MSGVLREGAGRRGGRLGDDRQARARPRRTCSSRCGTETKRRRRLGQLRTRPAARRPGQTRCPWPSGTQQYIELGKKWAAGHKNRMIKVPATPGGLAALEELVAAGVTSNVTLIFSERQYKAARDACWRGAQRRIDTRHVQDRLQHLRQPAGRVHREARPGPVAGGPGAGRHRQRQADLAAEPGVLGRQGAAAASRR